MPGDEGISRFGRYEMKKLALVFALSTGLVLAACNTVEGVGQDVQSAGEAVEDVAD
jgi:predicted small secreted protein